MKLLIAIGILLGVCFVGVIVLGVCKTIAAMWDYYLFKKSCDKTRKDKDDTQGTTR